MPCTAKKYEASRPEMSQNGIRDVDIVLTTREFIKMIKYVGLDFASLEESEFDSLMGVGSGAGAIFGTTGGVMEAALRTVAEVYAGSSMAPLEFMPVRGNEGIKEAVVKLGDKEIKVAVAHGIKNAEIIMEKVKMGTCDYTFVEVMACPGIDESSAIRKSHENIEVKKLYKDFLGEPLGKLSHQLLHTHYGVQEKIDYQNCKFF